MQLMVYKVTTCSFHDIIKTSFHETNQVNPGESYDPLLMALIKSTSISVDEWEDF
jgi:hypothetical protein